MLLAGEGTGDLERGQPVGEDGDADRSGLNRGISRQNRPKQMLPLVEDRTMFQVSVDRLAPLLPPDYIHLMAPEAVALQAILPD